MAKRIAALLLSAAVMAASLPTTALAVPADEGRAAAENATGEEAGAYVLMNIPFADFYGSEGIEEPDVVTSATFKVLNNNLASASYHDGYIYTEETSKQAEMLGVTYPVYVEDISLLEGLTEVTDESQAAITVAAGKTGIAEENVTGKDVLFASPSYAYYKLAEAPAHFKNLTATEGGFAFDPVAGDARDGGEVDVTMNYGGHHTEIEFIVASDEVAAAGKVNAAILTTSDGQKLALKPVYHIWRLTQLGWDYDQWDLGGKTVTGVRFFLEKDGEYSVVDYTANVTIKRKAEAAIKAAFTSATSLVVTNLPEDIENPVATVKTKVGRGEVATVIAENVPVANNMITANEPAELGKTYVVTVVSDNYADLTANVDRTLDAPVFAAAENTANGILLTWEENPEADSFTLCRDGEEIVTQAETSYLDAAANVDGQKYVYTLTATKTVEETVYTSPVSISCGQVFVAPTEITSVANKASATKVTWKKAAGAAGYEIYRDGKKVKTISGADTVTFDDSGAKKNGKTYSYAVVVFRDDGEASFRSAASAAVESTFVERPVISSIVNVAGGMKLAWKKVAGAGGYLVYRDGKKVKSISGADTVSYVDTVAKKNGTSYKYTVVATRKVKDVLVKSAASAAVENTFVERPVISAIGSVAGGTKLVWKKVAGAGGYLVYRDGKKVKSISGADKVSFIDTAAKTNGTSYKYTVVAARKVKDVLIKSAASAEKINVFLAKGAVSELSNKKAGKLTVSWKKNAKATGYEVKFVYGGKTVTKTYAGADTVTKTIKATKGTVYTVSVRAYKKSGKQVFYGAWSAAKKVKVTK